MTGWDDPAMSIPGATLGVDGELLGRGGEGVVVAGRDRRLPRDVAWKVVAADDPAGAMRLQREAEILARLDHPNIVPVYDLVRGDDGSLRLALRQVRGQTLRQALAERDPERRLHLLPHVLAAAHAIAWAHDEGILHRDLNAANVMIGHFGETQVIDWGIACERAHAPNELAGTPRTMSPEQARGEAASPRSDVWGLGTLLHELLTGAPLVPGVTDVGRILAARRLAELAPIVAPHAPPALVAIAQRALAPTMEERYPDAAAFASDLSAYLDGRVVSAHRYTARELLLRFVTAFKLPIIIGLVVIVSATVAGVIAYERIAVENEETARARDAARAALVEADLTNARSAMEADLRPEAELAAARVLAHVEHPEARGILAALGRSDSPRRLSRVVAAPSACSGAELSPSGRSIACYGDGVVTVYGEGPSERRRLRTIPRAMRFLDEDRLALTTPDGLIVLDVPSGRLERRPGCAGELMAGPGGIIDHITECVVLVPSDLSRAIGPRTSLCGTEPSQAAAPAGDGVLGICPDGTIIISRPGRPIRAVRSQLASPIGNFRVIAPAPDLTTALVGTARGELLRVSLESGEVLTRVTVRPARLVRWIEPRGPLALVHIDGDLPVVHHAESLVELARFPRSEGRGFWLDGPPGATPRIATLAFGKAVTRSVWSLPDLATMAPHLLDGRLGTTSAAFTEDGRVAITWTDQAEIIDIKTGATLLRNSWAGLSKGVTKMVAVDGPGGLVALSSPTLSPVPVTGDPLTGIGHYRRLVPLPSEGVPRFVGTTTGQGMFVIEGQDRIELLDPRQHDIEVRGALLASLGTFPRLVSLFDLAASPEPFTTCDAPNSQSVALLGPSPLDAVATLILSEPSGAWVLGADCRLLLVLASSDEPTMVAATPNGPNGPLFAAGMRNGGVEVWDSDGTLRASLPAHSIAVRALDFSPDGALLASGAWDGRVRLMAMAPLFAPREALVARILATWSPPPTP